MARTAHAPTDDFFGYPSDLASPMATLAIQLLSASAQQKLDHLAAAAIAKAQQLWLPLSCRYPPESGESEADFTEWLHMYLLEISLKHLVDIRVAQSEWLDCLAWVQRNVRGAFTFRQCCALCGADYRQIREDVLLEACARRYPALTPEQAYREAINQLETQNETPEIPSLSARPTRTREVSRSSRSRERLHTHPLPGLPCAGVRLR